MTIEHKVLWAPGNRTSGSNVGLAEDDSANHSGMNAVPTGDVALKCASRVFFTNSPGIGVRQRGDAVPFAALLSDVIPPLGAAVQHVVALCAEKEVIWSGALRVVATVTNVHSIWNVAEMNLPRNTMRSYFGSSSGQEPIAVYVPKSSPLPATVRPGDARPKPIFNRDDSGLSLAPGAAC